MSMTTRKKSSDRHGVTLLEILICIGILAIGLLGVVSLIPVGHFAIAETAKADRSTACAKAAKTQIQLRGMLDADNWRDYLGGKYMPGNDTIALDPLGVAHGEAGLFPFVGNPDLSSPLQLTRLTTTSLMGATGFALADRLCRWSDDLIVDVDDSNPDLRPRQTFTFESGAFAPYPIRSTDDNPPADTDIPILRQSKGDYSWFLTVTPDIAEVNAGHGLKTFEVATVVCYKRSLSFDPSVDVPSERLVEVVDFAGVCGAGSSDIPLVAPSTLSTDEERLEYLKVKKGQWIMLVGTENGRTIARWYKVIMADDEITKSGSDDVRWITVTGPEWNTGVTQAILVDGIIGVFTETMTIE